jgi:thioredoxin 1
MLSPVLEKLTTDDTVKTGGGQTLDLMTVDVDEQSELAQKYKVSQLCSDAPCVAE